MQGHRVKVSLSALVLLAAVAGCLGAPRAHAAETGFKQTASGGKAVVGGNNGGVTAIDIAINPDATMLRRASEANEELRMNYPEGYALDATHHPHITIVQRFVKTADLEKVYEAAGRVLANEKPTQWKLRAFKLNYFKDKGKDAGLECIVVEPTPQLLKLQEELIAAVAPYTVSTGTADAFETTPDHPEINEFTVYFVTHFLELGTGKKFSPHVSTGVGKAEFLDKVTSKPFKEFTFSPAGVSVFHLGDYGTAREELKKF